MTAPDSLTERNNNAIIACTDNIVKNFAAFIDAKLIPFPSDDEIARIIATQTHLFKVHLIQAMYKL